MLLQFLGGLVLLVVGGELLVRGATRIAAAAGVSALTIGLTVVAFGTSSPELFVSLMAARAGQPDIAVGNVVGSNVFNVLFILGLCALVSPLVVARTIVRRDIPIVIVTSLGLWFFALDGNLGLGEGVLFLAALAGVTWYVVVQSRREMATAPPEARSPDAPLHARYAWLTAAGLIVAGLVLLVFGSRWLVTSAVALARVLGLDEVVIALTIVAAGTSLPEVATSLVATVRGQRDIAVGNVVGSNIFNILGILGVSSLAAGGRLSVPSSVEAFDIPVMVAAALACLPFMVGAHRLARWEGALFLVYYAAYLSYVVLAANQHAALPLVSAVMLEFVVPLTVVTVGVVLARRHGILRGAATSSAGPVARESDQ